MHSFIRNTIKFLAYFFIEVTIIYCFVWIINKNVFEDFKSAAFSIALIGLINLIFWPLIVKFTLPIIVFTLGFASLIFNGILIYLVSLAVPGFTITNFWDGIWMAVVITITNSLMTWIFSVNSDKAYYRNIIRKQEKNPNAKANDKNGIIYIEIDGLSKPVLDKALAEGYMPHLKHWLETSHQVEEWETDLSCQTGGCQLGIMQGSNVNVPAFRWWDRKDNRYYISGGPACTPIIEGLHSSGNGLLSDNGASRGNLFSGDATDNVLTHSQLSKLGKIYTPSYYAFFSYPYSYIRLIVLMIQDMWFEFNSQRRQKKEKIVPNLVHERRGFYYIIRSFMTVFLKEINTFTLIGDIYKGEVNAVYASYVGYDELAHHSGVMDIDAFKHLTEIDRDLNKLYTAGQEAPRKYDIVVISDHGQSWGETFLQRYGYTLDQLIKGNIEDGAAVSAELNNDEGVMNLKILLDDMVRDDSSFLGKIFKPFKKKTKEEADKVEDAHKPDPKVLIYASGNLGLVYFPDSKERLTKEEVDEEYPLLLENLIKHPGISFVMVDTKNDGPVVIDKEGMNYLESGKIEGLDPLRTFRKLSVQHLLREHSFHNCPDILINSMFDPVTGEVAAFEELIGNHGGMGGYQSRPFVLHPRKFAPPSEKIVGAEQLHKVLKGWRV